MSEEFRTYKELYKYSEKLEVENKRLKKRLAIATKALKEYADITNWSDGNFMCVYDGTSFADEESAEESLKEIEEIQ